MAFKMKGFSGPFKQNNKLKDVSESMVSGALMGGIGKGSAEALSERVTLDKLPKLKMKKTKEYIPQTVKPKKEITPQTVKDKHKGWIEWAAKNMASQIGNFKKTKTKK